MLSQIRKYWMNSLQKLLHRFSSFFEVHGRIIGFFLCTLFFLASSVVSLNRYWQYDVFYYDFGIFDQAIWSVSRFQPPIIDHLAVGHRWIFADHFSPGIFLLSPLYWVTDKQEILLLAQAAAVALSGLFLYLTSVRVLKTNTFSLVILGSYFLFIGVQNAVITDFHEVTVMSLPLMMTFWAIAGERKILFFLSFLSMLVFKESTFLIGIGIGIFMLLIYPRWRNVALISIALSCAWGFLAIQVIIPYFSDGIYSYSPQMPSGVGLLTGFVDDQRKLRTLWYSFSSFGFFPLFAPSMWPLLLQDLATRFLPQFSETRWGLGLHYNISTGAFLALSSVYGLRFLYKKLPYSIITAWVLLAFGIAVFYYRFTLRGPLALSYNPVFYRHSKDFGFLNSLVERIPKHASVMTQNNLASHLTHQQVYLLSESYSIIKPEYIVLDLRGNQNPNNFFPTKKLPSLLKSVREDKNYETVYKTKEQYIYRRKAR